MPQLSTITAEQLQPPLQQDAKHPFCSRTPKPLSYPPSFPSFSSHHTKPLTCSVSQQCPPHTEQPRHPSIFKQQPKLCKQDQIAPGNIPLGCSRAKNKLWESSSLPPQIQDDNAWEPASLQSFQSSISSTLYTQCAHTPACWVPFKYRSHLRG